MPSHGSFRETVMPLSVSGLFDRLAGRGLDRNTHASLEISCGIGFCRLFPRRNSRSIPLADFVQRAFPTIANYLLQ
jgi:hypothetical protein